MDLLFRYVAMLRAAGPQEWVWQVCCSRLLICFREPVLPIGCIWRMSCMACAAHCSVSKPADHLSGLKAASVAPTINLECWPLASLNSIGQSED